MASSSEKIPGTEDEASNKTLERCLKVLQDAKNDSEQFAALLLVTKVVKAGETDAGTRRRIFDAIGFSFPNRLLVTKESPSGCPNQIFRALGMTLFACFSTNPEMVSHPQMFNKIPIFNEIVSSLMEPGSDITTFTSMIDDSYQCLQALSACSEGQRQLVTQGTVSALCRAYQNQCHGCEKALCLLVNLLNAMGNICWNTCKPELLKVKEEQLRDPFLFASVRVLSAWMAEETSTLKQEICEVLPFLIHYAEVLFEYPIRSDNMDSEVKELSLTDSSEAKTWSKDALRFLLPGFCHLSAEDAPRRILISHGFHVLLLRYFTQQWEVFNSWQNAPLSPDDAEMNLQTACGVFLNLAVTEPALIRQEECFSSLLNLLLESLQSMLCSQHYLILAANFTTLGLMISRILADTPVLQGNPASREFFRAAIHFLSKAHTTQNEEPDQKTRIVLTERYQEIWDQISELWFLGMQAFSSCIPLLPWLPQSIIESEWLNEIFDLLTQASPMTVEFDLITAFQCVLAELAKNNKSCKDSMLLKNGVEKASLYGMSILEQVLCEN
ncbi:neurochondrin isoform X2 [Pristis pectinata]|uniref:neurochondrin isoform X2 n=1 Tax=Pristis pectinata TaxID=685728 RepID=UPI00223D1310|nr:neurochondrin isoform X2 [Pristis pectinata]